MKYKATITWKEADKVYCTMDNHIPYRREVRVIEGNSLTELYKEVDDFSKYLILKGKFRYCYHYKLASISIKYEEIREVTR